MRGQCSLRLWAVGLLAVEIAWDALATLSAPLILGVVPLHLLALAVSHRFVAGTGA